MALTDDVNTTMLVQPSGGINYGNGGGLLGGDGLWLLLVLLLGGSWGGFGGAAMAMENDGEYSNTYGGNSYRGGSYRGESYARGRKRDSMGPLQP